MSKNLFLAKPTKEQLRWQDLELGMFCHFGLNTFYNREWGDGTDSIDVFNPSSLDVRKWVKMSKRAGFKYFILTVKHHDGFCLWPTKTTDYSVRLSPWKNGKGDIVKECADACQEAGILFGIYLSPWDRHEPCYPNEKAYDDFYGAQLKELLTGYGLLGEIWFDGAGSEGRKYNWARIISLIKKYQPEAMIFNMGEPTIRWVGNEKGVAPYPCWNCAKKAKLNMFSNVMADWLPETSDWIPAECDTTIHKGHWFWHPNDEETLLSLEELMQTYYCSVGRGTNLLLNIAPDKQGLIPEKDLVRVIQFGDEIRRRFANPIAETSGTGQELYLKLPQKEKVNHLILMEDIAHGERIREYVLEAEQQGNWIPLVKGSAVGHKKIDKFNTIITDNLRLRIISAVKEPLIRKMAAFLV